MGVKNEPFLVLSGLTKQFGGFTAVSNVALEIAEGEFFTLVGPSGSGKTTMIRLLVGMDQPTSGEIVLNGQRLNEVPANKRPTCMVFQNLALFPHKTVGENIEFPMKIAGVDPTARKKRAVALLDQLRLPVDYYDKGVNQCSGGERQLHGRRRHATGGAEYDHRLARLHAPAAVVFALILTGCTTTASSSSSS